MTCWVALLYSVVLTPSRRVRSADLIDLADNLGFAAARTVLSTNNLIFEASGSEADLAARIEGEMTLIYGKAIPVLLRSADDWRALVAVNPFPDPSRHDPAKVAVRVMRHETDPAMMAKIAARCGADESFAATPRALWLALGQQLSTSPLLRAMGAAARMGVGTWRNASAIRKIAAALD